MRNLFALFLALNSVAFLSSFAQAQALIKNQLPSLALMVCYDLGEIDSFDGFLGRIAFELGKRRPSLDTAPSVLSVEDYHPYHNDMSDPIRRGDARAELSFCETESLGSLCTRTHMTRVRALTEAEFLGLKPAVEFFIDSQGGRLPQIPALQAHALAWNRKVAIVGAAFAGKPIHAYFCFSRQAGERPENVFANYRLDIVQMVTGLRFQAEGSRFPNVLAALQTHGLYAQGKRWLGGKDVLGIGLAVAGAIALERAAALGAAFFTGDAVFAGAAIPTPASMAIRLDELADGDPVATQIERLLRIPGPEQRAACATDDFASACRRLRDLDARLFIRNGGA